MKTRTLGILSAVLVLLAFVTWVDYKRSVRRQAAEVQRERVAVQNTAQVRTLTVRTAAGAVRLERQADPDDPGEEAWWIVEPVSERADRKVVADKMLPALEEARKFGRFDLPNSERSSFGLEPPVVRIELGFAGGATQVVDLGHDTPVREQIYLRDAADPHSAWIAGVDLRKAFDRRLGELRDKTPVNFDFRRLRAIRLSAGDREFGTLERDGLTNWKMSVPDGPENMEADPRYVEQFFQLMQALTVTDATTATQTAEPLPDTAETPRVTIELLSRAAASTASHTVKVELAAYAPAEEAALRSGADSARPPVYRARVAGRDLLFAADSRLAAALRDPLRTFRDRRFITLPKEQVAWMQVEWRLGELPAIFALERTGAGAPWRFASDPDRPVQQSNTDAYVTFCQVLQVDSFDSEKVAVTPGAAGLTEPTCRVTMATPDRSRIEGFEIGSPVGKDSNYYYARRLTGSGKQVVPSPIVTIALAQQHLDGLRRPSSYFEVRTLLPFDAEQVAQVRVGIRAKNAAEPTTVTLTRAAGGAWSGRLGAGGSRALPAETASLLVATIGGLEYLAALERLDDDTRKQEGLDEPLCHLGVYDASGALLGGMKFGPLPEKKELLVVEDHLGRYRYVKKSSLNAIDQALNQVVSRLR